MTSTTNTTRNRRTKGIVAIASGALLLAGGSTFALWSAQSDVDGGTITAGNIEVVVAEGTWQDVSPEHADSVDIANLADFRILPGDVLQGSYPVDIAALGDNFIADLNVGFASPTGALISATEGVSLSYELFDAEGNQVGTDGSAIVLSADSVVVAPGAIRADNSTGTGTAELNAVVTATFDAATPDQIRTATEALLGDLTVNLTQKRA